jgi:UDP-glucose 4-epimerase
MVLGIEGSQVCAWSIASGGIMVTKAGTGWVVVTGGAGFIGSHLVEALVGEGRRVRVVDNLSTGKRCNLDHLGGEFEFVEGDLADFPVARQAMEGAEFVFHQAAIPSVPRSSESPCSRTRVGRPPP